MAQTALHTSQVHPLSTGLKLNYAQIKHTSVNKAQPNLYTNQTHLCQPGSTQSILKSNTPLSTRLNPIYAQIKHTSVNKAQPNLCTDQTHLCQQGSN